MTLITRITRLVKADLHSILDGLEEPEEVIKQAIRDMEEDIATQERQFEEPGTNDQTSSKPSTPPTSSSWSRL